MTTRRAEIVAIGDEFVHGQKVDTNSAWLAGELGAIGYEVTRLTVVSDVEADLVALLRTASERSDVIISTGGLGPTLDDRTRQAAAQAAGVDVVFDDDAWRGIEAMFARYRKATGKPVPESNRRQAEFPAGATVLKNKWGTAPGFSLPIGDATFYALPGVPREMRKLWAVHLQPELKAQAGSSVDYHCMQVIGLREAELGEQLAHLMTEGNDPKVGITASRGQLTIRVASFVSDRVQATVTELRAVLGEQLVYEGDHTLAEEVGRALIDKGVTVALAESCTGGLVAGELTAVSGISEVFLAGFVTYSNAAKHRDLGVPMAVLDEHGAVSEPVVAAMAEGAAQRSGARAAVAISGVAGPGGGTEQHPVGTVCFGVTVDGVTRTAECRFGDLGRELVRQRSVREALLRLYRALP